jgi:hypothetical protein
MSIHDLILREAGILKESKRLDAGLAMRSRELSKGSNKDGDDEVGAIYNPFKLNIKGAPIGDREKYVLPIAFTSGNYLYFYLLGEQPNSKTGVKVDTLFNKLASGAATVAALKNVLDSANAQFYDLNGDRLESGKHFRKFELKDEAQMSSYYEVEQAFKKFGTGTGVSPEPAKIIVGWKNEENPLDQKDVSAMQAAIMLNRADGDKIGKTSFKVRFSNAAAGGVCRISSIHRFTDTKGAGQPFPTSSSEIQAFVDSQPSGTEFTGTGGGARVRGALGGKGAPAYTLIVANKGNFKGIMDTGIYKHGDSVWQTAVNLVLKSLDKSEPVPENLNSLLEHWGYFDWNDKWKYAKWLLGEAMSKRMTKEEAIEEMKEVFGESSTPVDAVEILSKTAKVIQECIADISGEPLDEGILSSIAGKVKQFTGNGAQLNTWIEQYKNANMLKSCESLAIEMLSNTIKAMMANLSSFSAAAVVKETLDSAKDNKGQPRFAGLRPQLKGDGGLGPFLQKVVEFYNVGVKAGISANTTADELNRKLNYQGYLAKFVELVKKSEFGRIAQEYDKNKPAGGLGAAGRTADAGTLDLGGGQQAPAPAPTPTP